MRKMLAIKAEACTKFSSSSSADKGPGVLSLAKSFKTARVDQRTKCRHYRRASSKKYKEQGRAL